MSIRTLIHPLLAAAAVGSLCLGCSGYRLGAAKPLEFENIQSIAVPTFKNLTLEPRVSDLVTDSVIKQFHNDGTYTIGTVESADAILRGTIRRVDRAQLRSARFNTLRSRELRVRITVDYELEEAGTGVTLSRGTVLGDTNMFLDPNFQLTERQAFYDMSKEMAADLVSRLAEGWPGLSGTMVDDPERDRDLRIRRSEGQGSDALVR